MPYTFKDQLKEKEPILGKVLDALDIKDHCSHCYHFSPLIDDPGKGYRCKVSGSCPAATLHPDIQARLWAKYIRRVTDDAKESQSA